MIDQLQQKLDDAHAELDKAVLGKEEYEKREKRLEKKIKYLKDHVPPPAPRAARRRQHPQRPLEPEPPPDQQLDHPLAGEDLGGRDVRFTVTSGYRSPQYQCEICRLHVWQLHRRLPRPLRADGPVEPPAVRPGKGAVDVTNYYTFKAAQYRIGSPLRNYLGGQDPVHFSFTGR